MQSLMEHPRLCDLHIYCHGGQHPDVVYAHAGVLTSRSKRLSQLLSSALREPGLPMCLVLPETKASAALKLVTCLYSGEVVMDTKQELDEVNALAELLDLDLDIKQTMQERKKRLDETLSGGEKKFQANLSNGDHVDESHAKGAKRTKEKERERAKSVDESKRRTSYNDSEVVKLPKREREDNSSLAGKPNPLFCGSSAKAGPQKRRRCPEEATEDRANKTNSNEVKKMRPDESSSEVDSEALETRRREIPLGERRQVEDSSEDTDDDGEARRIHKRPQLEEESEEKQKGEFVKPRKNPFSKKRRNSNDKENKISSNGEKEDKQKPKADDSISKRKMEGTEDEQQPTVKKAISEPPEGAQADDRQKSESPKPKRKQFPGGRRPGPKSRTKRRDSVQNQQQQQPTTPTTPAEPKASKKTEADSMSGLFMTQSIQTCSVCRAFFLTREALSKHMKEHEEKKKEPQKKEASNTSGHLFGSDSESEKEAEEDEEPAKKRSPEQSEKKKKRVIKEKKMRKFAATSSSESEKECDSPPPERRKSGKIFVKLKEKSADALLESPKTSAATPKSDKAKPKSASSSSTPNTFTAASGFKCRFCEECFEKHSNLRNHCVNHFKAQMLEDLPSSKPFICPKCEAPPSRDKITLLRHYAFTHRMIYNFCTVRARLRYVRKPCE